MNLWYIADILAIVLICFFTIKSTKKGFLKSTFNPIATFVAILIVFNFNAPFCEYLEHSVVGDTIMEKIELAVDKTINEETEEIEKPEDVIEEMGLSGVFEKWVQSAKNAQTEGVEKIKDGIAKSVVAMLFPIAMQVVAVVILFVVVRLLLFVLFIVLKFIFEIKILGFFDRALGFLGGVFSGLLIIYLISTLLGIFTPAQSLIKIEEGINSGLLFKYFYNNNILLGLFF